MLRVIFIVCLLLSFVVALGAAKKRRETELCLDKSFTANIYSISNRVLGWDAMSQVWFDSVNGKVRIDTKLLDPIERTDVWYLFHNDGVGYRYDPKLKTCRKFTISKKELSTCLPKTGVFKRKLALDIGKTIKGAPTYVIKCPATNYVSELTVEPTKKNKRAEEVNTLGYPISLTFYGGPYSGMWHQAWSDFIGYGDSGIKDEKVFNIPKACTSTPTIEMPYPTENEVPVGPWFLDVLFA